VGLVYLAAVLALIMVTLGALAYLGGH